VRASTPIRPADDRGAVVVEFALVLPVLMVLLLGMVSGATAWNQSQSLGQGARVAGRYASTLPLVAPEDMDDWLDDIADRAISSSEGNLAIINAFRQSRNLAPISMEQLTRTSGDRVVDLRATKQFRFGSRTRFDVFLEAYNLLNTVNFENPSGVIVSGSFTTYTTARDARQIQWGARFQF